MKFLKPTIYFSKLLWQIPRAKLLEFQKLSSRRNNKFLGLILAAFSIFIFIMSADGAEAATCLWNGSASTAWNTAANWTNCGGVVPTSVDSVAADNSASGYTLDTTA